MCFDTTYRDALLATVLAYAFLQLPLACMQVHCAPVARIQYEIRPAVECHSRRDSARRRGVNSPFLASWAYPLACWTIKPPGRPLARFDVRPQKLLPGAWVHATPIMRLNALQAVCLAAVFGVAHLPMALAKGGLK